MPARSGHPPWYVLKLSGLEVSYDSRPDVFRLTNDNGVDKAQSLIRPHRSVDAAHNDRRAALPINRGDVVSSVD